MRYPDVTVPVCLAGPEGNAMAIMGLVAQSLRRAGVPRAEIDEFYKDATSGDYEHLRAVCDE